MWISDPYRNLTENRALSNETSLISLLNKCTVSDRLAIAKINTFLRTMPGNNNLWVGCDWLRLQTIINNFSTICLRRQLPNAITVITIGTRWVSEWVSSELSTHIHNILTHTRSLMCADADVRQRHKIRFTTLRARLWRYSSENPPYISPANANSCRQRQAWNYRQLCNGWTVSISSAHT